MKAQTLFIAASAFIGAFAAPVQKRAPQPDVITIYENVVHIVTTTSTVWVPPTQPTPKPEKKVEEVKIEEPKVEEEPVEEEEEEVPAPSPTSVYIPPTTTAAPTQAKAAEPTKAPAPSPAPAPEPVEEEEKEASTPEKQESTGGDAHTGEATHYEPAMGSCGKVNSGHELIAALPRAVMEAVEGANSNDNPLCGRTVEVTRGSKKVKVKVVDKCMGCAPDNIDLSLAAFSQLGNPDDGRIIVKWSLL